MKTKYCHILLYLYGTDGLSTKNNMMENQSACFKLRVYDYLNIKSEAECDTAQYMFPVQMDSIFAKINCGIQYMRIVEIHLTEYLAFVVSSSPSLSQLIKGLGFPWAEQLSRVLPPSLASTYCGGVERNKGGAVDEEEKNSFYFRIG